MRTALAPYPRQVARSLTTIGGVHLAMGDHAAAVESYRKALLLSEEADDTVAAAGLIGNIAIAHERAGDYAASEASHRRALALYAKLGLRADHLRTTCNLCKTLVDSGKRQAAKSLLSGIESDAIADPGVRVLLDSLRATLLRKEGKLEQAREGYLRVLEEAKRYRLRHQVADAHRCLRDVAEKQGDLAMYIAHNDAHGTIKEEIQGAAARLTIAMKQKQREIDVLVREHERERAVLYSTLPEHIADRVIRGEDVSGDHYEDAAVLFVDIVGFTSLSSTISPSEVVKLLHTVFAVFDEIVDRHRIAKIKTIGDAYLGVAFPDEEVEGGTTVQRAAAASLEFLEGAAAIPVPAAARAGTASTLHEVSSVRIRVGLHVGPVVAGIIGTQRIQYDVWGDAVNTASRMESTGEPGRVQVSAAFADALRRAADPAGPDNDASTAPPPAYRLLTRGPVEVRGKGTMATFWLEKPDR